MTDITPSKEFEQELARSRSQLSELSSHLQKAKEAERASVAREVHDNIGGNLTAIKIDLLWLAGRIGRQRPELLDKLRGIEALVDRTMETTSRIARNLRPSLLDLGLVAAIEWEANEFQQRTGIPCAVASEREELALDQELSAALFSIFREMLTNVAKHARARRVEVKIAADERWARLEVADDGCGMTGSDLFKRGSFGLRGMLERASHLGGEVQFKGSPGAGTRIIVRLPHRPEPPAPPAPPPAT
jgi:signal transduction histidine kinase